MAKPDSGIAMRTIATMLASFALAAPALADVTVTDGDSLVVNGSRIRLPQ